MAALLVDTPDSLLAPEAIAGMLELAGAAPPGIFVELGVYKGGSAAALSGLAIEQGRELHLYDTFAGIPAWSCSLDGHQPGDFADCRLEDVARAIPSARIFPGVFPDSLSPATDRIAFVHVDLDQYSWTRLAIRALWPRMAAGGIMLFDDYGLLEGATAAVNEELLGQVRKTALGKAYTVKGEVYGLDC